MTRKWGSTVDAIVELLSANSGPMTCDEMAAELEIEGDNLRGVVARMRKSKRLYVAAWFDAPAASSGRVYLRAAYSLGARRDARKPPRKTPAENQQRRRQRLRSTLGATSVFALGLNGKTLVAMSKQLKGMK